MGSNLEVKLLLDTHVWLWALQEPAQLGKKTQRLLENMSTELWLSPVSIWEAALLAERKRLRLNSSFEEWLVESQRQWPVEEASLTNAVAVVSREISVSHQDPADRFIAATAAVYELTLLTADKRLLEGRGYKHLSSEL